MTNNIDNVQLQEVLKQAYENLRTSLVAQHKAKLVALKDEFLAIRAAAPAEKPVRSTWDAWPSKGTMGKFEYRSNSNKRDCMAYLIVKDPAEANRYVSHPVYQVAADFDTLVQIKAEKVAESLLDGYVTKLTGKLSGVWGNKQLTEIKFSGHLDYHFISFTFADGSCFTVQNSVVHHVNNHGTFYAQFPTTFHNVGLANGAGIKQPSEAKMKKLFAAQVAAQ